MDFFFYKWEKERKEEWDEIQIQFDSRREVPSTYQIGMNDVKYLLKSAFFETRKEQVKFLNKKREREKNWTVGKKISCKTTGEVTDQALG